MIEIVSAQAGDALEQFIGLSQEYVQWMVAEIRERYPTFDLQTFTVEHDYDDVRKKFPGEHVPPHGCLLIARRKGEACGCVAVGRLTDTIGEIRTLFVRPAFRGLGVGKQLAEAAVREARGLGYQVVRLDTLDFMEGARGLYRSLGFYEIPPYLDLPESLRPYIHFLECELG